MSTSPATRKALIGHLVHDDSTRYRLGEFGSCHEFDDAVAGWIEQGQVAVSAVPPVASGRDDYIIIPVGYVARFILREERV